MKRVAICLHGDSSNWNKMKDSFMTNVIQALDPIVPDVFIHTFSNDNVYIMKTKTTMFKPICKKVDDYETFNGLCKYEADTRLINHNDYIGTIEALITTKKIKMLFEEVKLYEKNNNFKYDIVIFSTFDVQYLKPLNIENIEDENKLYLYTFEIGRDPMDKVVIGYRNCVEKSFVSRYDNIFKVNSEFIHFACPTNNTRLLFRYSYVKAGYGDGKWINIPNQGNLIQSES